MRYLGQTRIHYCANEGPAATIKMNTRLTKLHHLQKVLDYFTIDSLAKKFSEFSSDFEGPMAYGLRLLRSPVKSVDQFSFKNS